MRLLDWLADHKYSEVVAGTLVIVIGRLFYVFIGNDWQYIYGVFVGSIAGIICAIVPWCRMEKENIFNEEQSDE